jgi:hypothetical protein
MSNPDNIKNKPPQAQSQQQENANDKALQQLNVRPLPQNRPIATNTSQGIDDLMGYLD